MSQLGDIIYLQTFDGEELFVPDPEIRFLTYGNFGAPPVTFLTRKGYKQHGVTEIDYLLEPRTISVQIWQDVRCTRQEYWDKRLALHEFLRHNRGGPIQFTLRQPNGQLRALKVRANPGLSFPMGSPEENGWTIDEPLDFLAMDPIWFNPDTPAVFVSSVVQEELVFPITFPILFESGGVVSTGSITYLGTWPSFPTIRIYGPYTTATITNVTTGISVYMTVAIAAGERRTIDLTPGSQSVRDGFGVNRFSELGAQSNMVDWNLRPHPEVANGIQNVQASFVGGTAGQTAFEISYQERYFAL